MSALGNAQVSGRESSGRISAEPLAQSPCAVKLLVRRLAPRLQPRDLSRQSPSCGSAWMLVRLPSPRPGLVAGASPEVACGCHAGLESALREMRTTANRPKAMATHALPQAEMPGAEPVKDTPGHGHLGRERGLNRRTWLAWLQRFAGAPFA